MRLLHWLPRFLHRHKCIEILCKLGLQERIHQIKFNNGCKAIIDLSDPEPRNVFIKSEFEPHFFEIANAFLPNDGIFFDLGANVGFCSFGLAPSRSIADFHLFEASPKMIDLLTKSTELLDRYSIKLNHACISDKNGETSFHVRANQSGESHVATEEEDGINVPNLLLDQYCREHRISQVDFAKIDLEGHEVPALKGWKAFLGKQNIKALYIEIIPENQTRYGYETNEPLIFLESLGYALFLCKPNDFGNFGEPNKLMKCLDGMHIEVCKFKADEYPSDFSTDVLALPYY
jgi:FkbM family methyltransferase